MLSRCPSEVFNNIVSRLSNYQDVLSLFTTGGLRHLFYQTREIEIVSSESVLPLFPSVLLQHASILSFFSLSHRYASLAPTHLGVPVLPFSSSLKKLHLGGRFRFATDCPSLGSLCPQLTSLSLKHVIIEYAHQIIPLPPLLKSLELGNVQFEVAESTCLIFGAFPASLERLRCPGTSFHTDCTTPIEWPQLSELELTLWLKNADPLMAWPDSLLLLDLTLYKTGARKNQALSYEEAENISARFYSTLPARLQSFSMCIGQNINYLGVERPLPTQLPAYIEVVRWNFGVRGFSENVVAYWTTLKRLKFFELRSDFTVGEADLAFAPATLEFMPTIICTATAALIEKLPHALKRLSLPFSASSDTKLRIPDDVTALTITTSDWEGEFSWILPTSLRCLAFSGLALPIRPLPAALRQLDCGHDAFLWAGFMPLPPTLEVLSIDCATSLPSFLPYPPTDLPVSLTSLQITDMVLSTTTTAWAAQIPSTLPLKRLKLAYSAVNSIPAWRSTLITTPPDLPKTINWLLVSIFNGKPENIKNIPRGTKKLFLHPGFRSASVALHLPENLLDLLPKQLRRISMDHLLWSLPDTAFSSRGLPPPDYRSIWAALSKYDLEEQA